MDKQRLFYLLLILGLLGGMLMTQRSVAGSPDLSTNPVISPDAWQSVLERLPQAVNTDEALILRTDEPGNGDWFGNSVAIDGDTLVVGAHEKTTEDGVSAGAVYVFERNEGGPNNWGQVIVLHASDADDNDYFGRSVAIDGDTIVVGADGANIELPEDNTIFSAGAAYVFERSEVGSTWAEAAVLHADDADEYDSFGWAVAIDGDTLIVGAKNEDGESGSTSGCGAAYVFDRDEGSPTDWDQVDTLHASDAEASDSFGWSVDISGSTLVVSAIDEDTQGPNSGAIYVFERTSSWDEVDILYAEGDDDFVEVAIDGDTLVVGAKSSTQGDGSGAAYVFERNVTWSQDDILYASNASANDRFGSSVAISGDTIVVGAIYEDGETGILTFDGGAAYVFERSELETWDEVDILRASDAEADDELGNSVAVSGNTIAVGAKREDGEPDDQIDDSGAVYVFLHPTDLSLTKSVTPQSAEPGETITYTLSFSNLGELTASNFLVTDTIPARLTVTSFTSGGTISYIGPHPTYAWEVDVLAPSADGMITVTAELDYCLPVSIITNTATITMTSSSKPKDMNPTNNSSSVGVTVLNASPLAEDDSYTVTGGDFLVITALEGVLANDDDANCDTLTVTLDEPPANGELTLAADGSFVYASPQDLSGVEVFTYALSDGQGGYDMASVTITVVQAVDDYHVFLPLLQR